MTKSSAKRKAMASPKIDTETIRQKVSVVSAFLKGKRIKYKRYNFGKLSRKELVGIFGHYSNLVRGIDSDTIKA